MHSSMFGCFLHIVCELNSIIFVRPVSNAEQFLSRQNVCDDAACTTCQSIISKVFTRITNYSRELRIILQINSREIRIIHENYELFKRTTKCYLHELRIVLPFVLVRCWWVKKFRSLCRQNSGIYRNGGAGDGSGEKSGCAAAAAPGHGKKGSREHKMFDRIMDL